MEHYIRVENGLIVDGYSTAFRVPKDGDILINADGGRKFNINGVDNPQLKNNSGLPLYKWDGTQALDSGAPEGRFEYNGTEWVALPPTPAEQKLTGVEINGVMCSATSEDMWGLAAVKPWVLAGNSTNFQFQNGNTLELTAANLSGFEAIWIPFRASFF